MAKHTRDSLFYEYYDYWISLYKVGSVRPITLDSYWLTYRTLREMAPHLRLRDLNHQTYQELINTYAKTHERVTVKGFHHHLKASIVDGLDEGIIKRDPTRHLVLKGKEPVKKKTKYLSLLELKKLMYRLSLGESINYDWLILLISKTGLRLAEALGLTPNDFDFQQGRLKVTKTWNYKSTRGGFQPTKNKSSVRTITIDPILCDQFKRLTANLGNDCPIFIDPQRRTYVSTINYRLKQLCQQAGIPIISIHGLRHTHASLLMYDGVSISSVAKRLGHANTITTQTTYLHVVQELESKDNQKIMENMIRLS